MVGTSKKLVPVAWPVISGTTSQTMSKNPLESLQLILVGKWESHHDVWSPVVPRKKTRFFFKVSEISVDMNEPNKAISFVPRDSPKGAWGKTYQTIWSLHLDDFKQIPKLVWGHQIDGIWHWDSPRNWSMVQSWAISPIVLTKYTNSPNKLRATPRRYPNSAKMNLSQASSVVVQRVVFFGVAWCMGTRILSLLPPYPMLRPRKHDS